MNAKVKVNKNTRVITASVKIGDREITRKITSTTVAGFISIVSSTLGEFGLGLMQSTLDQMMNDLTNLCKRVESGDLVGELGPNLVKEEAVTAVAYWDKNGMGVDILGGGTVIASAGSIRTYVEMNLAVDRIASELVGLGMPEISDDVKSKIKNAITAGEIVRRTATSADERVFAEKSACSREIQVFPKVPTKESFFDKLLKGGLPEQVAEQVASTNKDELDDSFAGMPACNCPACLAEASPFFDGETVSEATNPIMHKGKAVQAFDLDFGTALNSLKAGEAIACDHWPQGVFLILAGTNDDSDYIVMHTSNNKLVPWAPTHESLLANCWVVLA